jgi:hypothetical protein
MHSPLYQRTPAIARALTSTNAEPRSRHADLVPFDWKRLHFHCISAGEIPRT